MTTTREAFGAKVNKEGAERVARLRGVLDAGLEALSTPLSNNEPAEATGGAGATLAPILGFLEATRSAGSQREILGALLDVAASCYPRTVLFILRSGALVAGDARNTEAGIGAGRDRLTHLTIPAEGDHLLARALAAGNEVTAGAAGTSTTT